LLQEQASPSFFNLEEIDLVLEYVKLVLAHRLDRSSVLPLAEIGIISPYSRQCQHIRARLARTPGWEAIKVFSLRIKLFVLISRTSVCLCWMGVCVCVCV
jgi:superfamily I DNA and/or RNA helicase